MKIYLCRVYDADNGSSLSWHSSKAIAMREFRKHASGDEAQGPEGVDAMEIPTNKAGLLAWLNAHYKTDNG